MKGREAMTDLLGGIIIILFGFLILFAVYLFIDMGTELIIGIIKAIKERKLGK